MMKLLIATFALIVSTVSGILLDNVDIYDFPTFTQYKAMYNKTYDTQLIESYREKVYNENVKFIHTENQKGHTYRLDINEFADIKPDEFFRNYRSTTYRFAKSHFLTNKVIDFANISVPQSIDWVENGAVTPVKNQGQCGSCWSFSTTGAIEGIHAIKSGQLVSLSEQQLVDCSSAYGNMGCNGGMPIWAYQYVIDNNGICSEASYAYTGTDGSCNSCNPVAQISGYVNVTSNSAQALMASLSQQPVSVVIEADQTAFQFYSSGVLTSGCGDNLDHAVLAVGYGTNKEGQKYFKIKNSWGTTWGDNGYVYFGADDESNSQNNGSGVCGVLSLPTFPTM